MAQQLPTQGRKGFGGLLPQYRVDGFDPNDTLVLATEVDELGQERDVLYLEVATAQRWFYTVFPNGSMTHVVNSLSDKKATVTASIYRDVNDTRPAITAMATRYYSDDLNGRFYEQNAVTAAYRKALDYLGFGTPPDARVTENTIRKDADELPEKGEAGVAIPRPIIPKIVTEGELKEAAASELDVIVEDKEPEKAPEKPKRVKKAKTETVETPAQETEQEIEGQTTLTTEAAPAKAVAEVTSVETVVVEEPTPKIVETKPESKISSEPKKVTTLEEAKAHVLTCGKNKGKTLEELAQGENGPRLINWYAYKMSGYPVDRQAAQVYCEYMGWT